MKQWCVGVILLLIPAFASRVLHAAVRVPIAFVEGFSGDDPHTARELLRGVELFLKDHPQAAQQIQLRKFDNRGSPQATFELMDAIARQGIHIVVGISKSDQAIAAARVATQRKMLFLTPFATNVHVTEHAPSVFRICYTDREQGIALAHFAQEEFSPSRVLILQNVDSKYSIGLAEQFQATFQDLHPKGTIHQFNYLAQDLRLPMVQNILQQFAPQLVFIPDHITRSSLLIKAIHQLDPSIAFLGGDGWGGKRVFQAVYPAPNGDIRLFYSTHWHEQIETEENRRFVESYRQSYPDDPITSGAALTYDAFLVLWATLQTCPSQPDIKCLAKAIEKGQFKATTGLLRFGVSHNPLKKIMLIRFTPEVGHSLYKTI